jgi:osmotically-inducible protein OsmY
MMIRYRAIVALSAIAGGLAVSTSLAQTNVPDGTITRWVRHALQSDPRVPASSIMVSTDYGIVTLSGDTPSIAGRQYAIAEAKKIDGVLGVIDDIVVVPTDRPDRDIGRAVRQRILDSRFMQTENLRVMSLKGRVTLMGNVATPTQRKEATMLASEVPGVESVRDRLCLDPEAMARLTDEEVKENALAALRQDVYLTALPVDVQVVHGRLTLSGSVGNAYERSRAGDDVRWLPGVKAFTNDLRVDYEDSWGVRDGVRIPTGEELTRAGRAILNEDYRVNPARIVVLGMDGQVTLDGIVPNRRQKELAVQDAKNLVGANGVNDNLFVLITHPEDATLREKVDYALGTDRPLQGTDIRTYVWRGIVTLAGNVDNWYQWGRAGFVASRVMGVRWVINDLVVQGVLQRPEAEIARMIRSRLESDPTTRPVADAITVTVHAGDAILTGSVATSEQLTEAGTVAFNSPGIWRVQNRLVVGGVSPSPTQLYVQHP